jgi:tyrosine-protein phosphatase SIW14
MLLLNRLSVTFFGIGLLAVGLPATAAALPGIKNFDQVDAHVYRGAQPDARGFQSLAKLGVKTVIDLREPGTRSKAEERMVSSAGMKYVNVPMSGFTPPTTAEITKILAMLEDSGTAPVFVHCWRGADRTGAVIAAYHIDHDNWDNARALQDAKAHKMSSFQLPRQNYISHFQRRTMEAAAKVEPGIAATAEGIPVRAGLDAPATRN